MLKKPPIVFCFNEAYRLPAWVAIASLLDHTPDPALVIVHDGLTPPTIALLQKLYPATEFICIDKTLTAQWPQSTLWPSIVYARLFLPELLPTADRIIYADVDIIFRESLEHLYTLNLEDTFLAAVPFERVDQLHGIHQKFPDYKNPFVFSSGFFVMDAEKVRTAKNIDTYADWIEQYAGQLKMFDLELMNLAYPLIKPLDLKYCVLESFLDEKFDAESLSFLQECYKREDIQTAVEHAIIYHYAGANIKIWDRLHPTPLYLSYIERSPFYDAWQKRRAELLDKRRWPHSLLQRIHPSRKIRKNSRRILKILKS